MKGKKDNTTSVKEEAKKAYNKKLNKIMAREVPEDEAVYDVVITARYSPLAGVQQRKIFSLERKGIDIYALNYLVVNLELNELWLIKRT